MSFRAWRNRASTPDPAGRLIKSAVRFRREIGPTMFDRRVAAGVSVTKQVSLPSDWIWVR